MAALTAEQSEVGFHSLQHDVQIGKLAVVGAGMLSSAGVTATLFTALFEAGINIEMISTSEIRITVVTRANQINEALRVVHSGCRGKGVRAVSCAGTFWVSTTGPTRLPRSPLRGMRVSRPRSPLKPCRASRT